MSARKAGVGDATGGPVPQYSEVKPADDRRHLFQGVQPSGCSGRQGGAFPMPPVRWRCRG
jgi:hypothetical protein